MFRSLIASVLVLMVAAPAAAAQKCDASKAETAPMSRFKAADNGTITDSKTKLVWMRCGLGMSWRNGTCEGQSLTYKWNAAQDEVDGLNAKKVGGRSDWRLPTESELLGIVEQQCFKPAINLDAFPFTPESGFWTSTEVQGINNPRAKVVLFIHGKAYVANKQQTWRVRPVAGK